MINLIADLVKTNTRYAVKNAALIRYTYLAIGTALAIGMITAVSILTMFNTQNSLNKQLDDQKSRLSGLQATETKGAKLYDQINTIQELLKRQIKFSDLLPEMAKVLPPGAIFKQLDISASDVVSSNKTTQAATSGAVSPTLANKPFVIHAATVDRDTANTLLENILARKDLFTNAEIIDITFVTAQNSGSSNGVNSSDAAVANKYPYLVTINAYFNKKSTTPGLGSN